MGKNKTIKNKTRAGAHIGKAAMGAMYILSAGAMLWFIASIIDVNATNLYENIELSFWNFFRIMNTLFC